MYIVTSEIGRRIKIARKSAKLSQLDLADQIDKSLRTIQKYESGDIAPSISTINKIAMVLDVSSFHLIGYPKKHVLPSSEREAVLVHSSNVYFCD